MDKHPWPWDFEKVERLVRARTPNDRLELASFHFGGLPNDKMYRFVIGPNDGIYPTIEHRRQRKSVGGHVGSVVFSVHAWLPRDGETPQIFFSPLIPRPLSDRKVLQVGRLENVAIGMHVTALSQLAVVRTMDAEREVKRGDNTTFDATLL